MALTEVQVSFEEVTLPSEVEDFIVDADKRVAKFLVGKPFAEKGYVACNHRTIAKALIAIQRQGLSAGATFCEWGSGFGGVASIAAMLGFESYGIEINPELLQGSIELADDYGIEVEFVDGSFIPDGADDLVDQAYMENEGDVTLETHFAEAYQDLELEVSDFDIIFVFPWPNDAPLIANLFDRYASSGGLLLTFNDFSGLKIDRKSFAGS
ncbi:hypothetical protein OAG56_05715 [Mariniblastus sp.]|nr:hypothetical protein [Mariniblastus sp.]MDB4756852.1 hypothetical protein [Mariniblastus sp.]